MNKNLAKEVLEGEFPNLIVIDSDVFKEESSDNFMFYIGGTIWISYNKYNSVSKWAAGYINSQNTFKCTDSLDKMIVQINGDKIMKKKIWTMDGNKMIINSGHKEFDNQTVCISDGNVVSPTQLSVIINKEAHLKITGHYAFEDWFGIIPNYIRNDIKEYIEKLKDNHSIILYKFSHYGKKGKVIHGYVLTTSYPEYKLLRCYITGPTNKSTNVIEECIKYITNGKD